ncbi:ATP-binding protein [Caloramator australicus]|uniref:Nucleotidyltransferase n=1 Tax=Caloramator australicus RC3 TaxID=857293 RepID=I7J4N5_9CLOT|nr:DUF87 domain-containing protein [Caloramator australicus]CCJ32776.1 Nucleotidyltransferase [Caloramator australicus RC3]
MNYDDYKIGRIVKIQEGHITVEVTEQNLIDKLIIDSIYRDFLVTINGLLYCYLPNGKKAIARINQINDKKSSYNEDIFINKQKNYIVEAVLIGVYDDYEESFQRGINLFPIIGSEVYSVNNKLKSKVLRSKYKYELSIGISVFNDDNIVYANPDILFGKHLGIFGNTGSGKTCTLVSIIQGLKKRLKKGETDITNISPKIIIFDTNDEYEKAFSDGIFKIKIYNNTDLKLPHFKLNDSEYIKFFNASEGIQLPTLRNALLRLREKRIFSIEDILEEIEVQLNKIAGQDNNYKRQLRNWLAPLYNRIYSILDNDILKEILVCDKDIVEEIMNDDSEITLIKAELDKNELDIVMFLFAKILYSYCIESRDTNKLKNIVLILEEAHRYINDKEANDYKLGYYYIERLAREGRKYGISLIISSQRPSELSETVISQCNSFIIHKITNKKDIEIMNKILDISSHNFINLLPNIEKQHALVMGEAFNHSDIVQIFPANPLPRSGDPNVIDSWKVNEQNEYLDEIKERDYFKEEQVALDANLDRGKDY